MGDDVQQHHTGAAEVRIGFSAKAAGQAYTRSPDQVVTRAGVIDLRGASDQTRASVAVLLSQMDREKEARERAERDAEEQAKQRADERRLTVLALWFAGVALLVAVASLVITVFAWQVPVTG